MKDYVKLDLDEFRKNNLPLYEEIRKDAGKHSEALGISVPKFIEWKLKEAHAEHLLRMGVQDTFEYCVDKHEPDSALALKIVHDRRKEIASHLGLE